MTDVYISYAREDRESVRKLSETLRLEGWDVWMDPSEPLPSHSAALDIKLASAGAILVVWSGYSRGSETVRSEAATGLYKNKLIQVRIDAASPPRPFDQVEVVDIGRWSGEREDAIWRKVVSAVRLHAGVPEAKPQVSRKAAPPPPKPAPKPEARRAYDEPRLAYPEPKKTYDLPEEDYVAPKRMYADTRELYPEFRPERQVEPPRRETRMEPRPEPRAEPRSEPRGDYAEPRGRYAEPRNSYAEPKRSGSVAPLVVAAALIAAGAGVWFVDPFGWRSADVVAEAPEVTQVATLDNAAGVAPAAAVAEDTEESLANWTRVSRDSSAALRDYVSDYPRSSNAETAKSLLRVRDAQAWVKAVTTDNDGGYQAYLKEFPATGTVPGAMATSATERLTALSAERVQAVRDIQSGLSALSLYDGMIDGQGNDETLRAVKQFASQSKRSTPVLATAAPRDLRTFAEALQKAAGTRSTKSPIVASATTSSDSAASAAEADRQRIAQAQAAAKAATQTAAVATSANADALAAVQQDADAWAAAERSGTAAGYQSYLASYPTGAQAASARAAIVKISNKPAAFSLDQISGDVKVATEAARRAQTSANARASSARDAASAAANATGLRSIVAANGDQYEAQISGGAPNGLGIRVAGSAANAGDRYRGEMRDGQSSGLGVYEYGANPSNTGGAARYEGEHARGGAVGYGVTYWKNGDNFAGQETSANGQSRGVFTFANGQKYEGELRDGTRNGFGVVWGPDGALMAAGRWANGELVEPMKTAQ